MHNLLNETIPSSHGCEQQIVTKNISVKLDWNKLTFHNTLWYSLTSIGGILHQNNTETLLRKIANNWRTPSTAIHSTNWCLVTPYVVNYVSQYWFRLWSRAVTKQSQLNCHQWNSLETTRGQCYENYWGTSELMCMAFASLKLRYIIQGPMRQRQLCQW